MSNGTKKNIKIVIPSSLDDEDARMLVIPLLCIDKPHFYGLADVKQRNLLPGRNYDPDKSDTITWAADAGRSDEAAKGCPNENLEAVSVDVAILDAAENSPSEQNPCPRERLLADASTDVAKNIFKELYRPSAAVGDGGTADAIRKQIITGELVGGRDHIRKGRERLRQIEKILSKNPNFPDKDLLERLRNDLIDALGDV